MSTDPVILIADDHSMIRKGLKLYLQLNFGCKDIYEVMTCNDLMQELKRKNYTHLILDIILADGNSLEVIPEIKQLYPHLNIMGFSMQPTEVYGEALKEYNIPHYVSKSESETDIINHLGIFLQNEHPDTLVKTASNKPNNPFAALAPRELEILHHLLKGNGTKEIAISLDLKMNTVSTIKSRIFEKTHVQNLKELIEMATLYNVNF
ncbi:MAG: response regulator transcription factor [Ferruginibacter sp.]